MTFSRNFSHAKNIHTNKNPGINTDLQTSRLLFDLQGMLLPEFGFGTQVIVCLVVSLSLMLLLQLLVFHLLQGGQVLVLQVLGGLMVPHQHGVLILQLCSPLGNLLEKHTIMLLQLFFWLCSHSLNHCCTHSIIIFTTKLIQSLLT